MNSSTLRKTIAFYALAALLGIFSCIAVSRPVPLHATEVAATSQTLQSAATSGNGTVLGPAFMSRCRETAVYVNWSAGTNAGAVTIETADDPSYTGTWALLQAVNWSAASKQDVVQVTGVMLAMRARISTNVTGGTVKATAICN